MRSLPRGWPRRLLTSLVVFAVLAVPTALQTLPPPSQLGHEVAPNSGDPLFIAWTLGSESHAVAHHPSAIFAADIFYPRRDAIAWSDNLIVMLPVFAALRAAAGGNSVTAYNLLTWLGYLGIGLATYLLAREIIKDRRGALIAGLLCAVSPMRSLEVGHTQLIGYLFVPLAVVALIRFLKSRRRIYAVGLGAAVAATWLSTAYYTFLAVLVLAAFLLVWALQHRGRVGARFWSGLGLAAAVALALVGWTLPPYLRLQSARLFDRSPTDQIAPTVADLHRLPPSPLYRLADHATLPAAYGSSTLYPGAVLLALAAVAVVAVVAGRIRRPEPESVGSNQDVASNRAWCPAWAIAAGSIPAIVLTVGPNLGALSRPFDILRDVMPGVSSLRELSRFWIYPVMCGALLAGAGASTVLRRIHARAGRDAVVIVVALLAVIELVYRPPFATVDLSSNAVAADRALSRLPPGPVYELPEPLGPTFPYVMSLRMLRSLVDEDPRIDGRSGNLPSDTVALEDLASRDSPMQLVSYLRAYGARYLLLHHTSLPCTAGYSSTELAALDTALRATPGVASVRFDGDGLLVTLTPAPIDRSLPVVAPGPARPDTCTATGQ